jgi:hypothetical protein
MTAVGLIALLQKHDPAATIVLWDHAPHGSQVSKLGHGEVQSIELGTWESNGVLILEVWNNDLKQDGPYPGVVLGSK